MFEFDSTGDVPDSHVYPVDDIETVADMPEI